MCLFKENLFSVISRQHLVRQTLRNEKIRRPNPNDVVRLLGLTKENQFEKAASFIQPLWKKPYEEQLRFKEERVARQLLKLSKIAQDTFDSSILDDQTKLFRSLTISPIVPSPKITEYRSKETYVVSFGVDGDPTTVGLPYGSGQLCLTVPPTEMQSVAKPVHRTIAHLFQNYLQHAETPVDVVSPNFFVGGGFKQITIRSSRLQDKIMLIGQFRKGGFKMNRIDEEAQRLADYFLGRTFSELPATTKIASFYFQRFKKTFCLAADAPYEHWGGDTFIEETLLGKTFRISAATFFQINVECAEVLFQNVINQCPLDKNTVLLDVGCGAGVFSIVLANHVKRAVGIDVNPHCITDAEENANLNGVTNASFICGRLETVAPSFLDETVKPGEKLVAIVNPGRWGLMAESVMALRRLAELKTLIYVSCYPYESAFANFVYLTRHPNEEFVGEPFRLIKAIPVDMFPQTPHYELILLFQR